MPVAAVAETVAVSRMVVASWFVIAGLAMPVTDNTPVDGTNDNLVDAVFCGRLPVVVVTQVG